MFEKIIYGFSNKSDGNLRLNLNPSDNQAEINRTNFLKGRSLNDYPLVSAELVHRNKIVGISKSNLQRVIMDCDALITNEPGVILSITAADCLPIYFYDQQKEVVAMAHAGWRGVLSKISQVTINSFIEEYGSNPKDIEIFIGPHIKSCHFEIQTDIVDQFHDYREFILKNNSRIFVDLAGAVRQQLISSQVRPDNIYISEECTYCSPDKYFSYRRDKPQDLETMLAYIGLKKS